MKKYHFVRLFAAVLLAMLGLEGQAQQTWNFTSTPSSDISALEKATSEWTYDSTNNRFVNVNAVNGALIANGQELQMTKGLSFTNAAAGKIKIDVNKRIQLGGKNITVSTPSLTKGQIVTITFVSTGTTPVTFDALTNLENTSGFVSADKSTTQVGKGTVAADGVVSFKSTGGSINIFSIEVSNPSGGGNESGGAAVTKYDVPLNLAKNQVSLHLFDGDIKYYNTQELDAIDINGGNIKVTPLSADDSDLFEGSVETITFAKKAEQGEEGEYGNVEGKVEITEAKGWLESAYITWKPFSNASSYVVYVKGGPYASYTKLDDQLVRNYGTYGRADMVGLKSASDYVLKVVPVISGKESETNANEASALDVKSYSRQGFAFMGNYAPGAYNSDGTLKSGAKVFYVTKNTAKTITTKVVTGSKGKSEEVTGVQKIIDAYQKGYDTTPIAFRLVGLVELADLDAISSSSEGLQIKGKNADSEMNMTIEGIGDDAAVRGFGFLVRNCKGVEFRNFAVIRCMDDGISLDTDNSNIWIHHMDMFYGKAGSGDHGKGDGAIDVKSDSKYVTVSYNRFWDTGKSNMFGMKSESGENWISYDHNWFDHSDSRHPRIRTMSVHVWNNYFDNCAKYGVGATSGSSVFVENNYFLKTKKPILSSLQGTDALGSGTFSGEDGGMIKAYGNYFDRSTKNFSYYTQSAPSSKGYDAYETSSRDEQVPSTEKTVTGGTTYNNFDTNSSKMYAYSVDAVADVPAIVTGYYGAGRLNHGDISYSFADNVGNDDTDSKPDEGLESLIDSYASSLVGIFGDENAVGGNSGGESGNENGGEGGNGGSETGGSENVDGTILCTFDKSGNPSSTLFTVNGNGSNSKGSATIDGVEYTTCLKLENSTSVKFTLSKSMTMTLYFGSTETASIKVDGTKVTDSSNTYTQVLQAGSHELTKADARNLFGIKLVPVE